MQPEEEGVEIVEGSFPTPNIDLQDEEETVTEIEGPRRPERSHSNL